MTATTPLDRAHAAMEAAPDDPVARVAFYEHLAAAELFLLLDAPPSDDVILPRVFPVDGIRLVAVFDLEERLADFAGGLTDYVSVSGRALVRMLAEDGLAIGLNLGVAPSSFVVPGDAVLWLAERLLTRPVSISARPREFHPPVDVSEAVLRSIDRRLAALAGLADTAILVGVTYEGGQKALLLAISGADPEAGVSIAEAMGEAILFSGDEGAAIDVGFLSAGDPVIPAIEQVGLRFDLPRRTTPGIHPAPGSEPLKPPRLR